MDRGLTMGRGLESCLSAPGKISPAESSFVDQGPRDRRAKGDDLRGRGLTTPAAGRVGVGMPLEPLQGLSRAPSGPSGTCVNGRGLQPEPRAREAHMS